MHVLFGVVGVIFLLAVAVFASVDWKRIKVRTVASALLAQIVFGAIVLYWDTGRRALQATADVVQTIIDSAGAGIGFVFGSVLDNGFVFAFHVLPVIVFFASLTSVLYHVGVLQWVVRLVGGLFAKLFGTTIAESMNTAANIFLGHTEAPLLIKPYLRRLTQSELFAVMTGGMATVAGSVLVGYSLMGVPLEYLIAAAFMAAPGALAMAKIIVPAGVELKPLGSAGFFSRKLANRPEKKSQRVGALAAKDAQGGAHGQPVASEAGVSGELAADGLDESDDLDAETVADTAVGAEAEAEEEQRAVNVVDAAARGASEGLHLALNIGAMLIAFISLIALINLALGGVGGIFHAEDLTLQRILGWVLAPVMFLLGVPWGEAVTAGSFVGQKVVLNEFVAFSEFGPVVETLSAKTQAIVTFALTGFANFAAIAMQIGGLGGLAPNQKQRIARLGMRAVLAGTLANLMSAAIAGIMVTL